MKIPIYHYTRVPSDYTISDNMQNCYLTNKGGKIYLVEILA